jgi:hypothetical protein
MKIFEENGSYCITLRGHYIQKKSRSLGIFEHLMQQGTNRNEFNIF